MLEPKFIDQQLMLQHRVELESRIRLTNHKFDTVFAGRYCDPYFSTRTHLVTYKDYTYKLENNERCAQIRDERKSLSEAVRLATRAGTSSTTAVSLYREYARAEDSINIANIFFNQARQVDQDLAPYRSGVCTFPAFTILPCNSDRIPCLKCSKFPVSTFNISCDSCQHGRTLTAILDPKPLPSLALLKIYSEERGVSLNQATRELAEKLKIAPDEPFASLRNLESEGWYRQTFEIQPCPNDSVAFKDDEGNILGVVVDTPNGYVPKSRFCFLDSPMTHELAVPFGPPFPLLNQTTMRMEPSYGIAFLLDFDWVFNNYLHIVPYLDDHIVTTSFGSSETINEIDVSPLTGRQVTVFANRPGRQLPDEGEVETAIKLAEKLEPIVGDLKITVGNENGFEEPTALAEFGDRFGTTSKTNASLRPIIGIKLETAKQFIQGKREIEFLIPPLIMKSSTFNLYGGSSTAKSLLFLALSVAIASGTEIFPFMGCASPGRVLYWDGECRDGLRSKFASVCRGMNLDPEKLSIDFVAAQVDLLTEEGRQEVNKKIEKLQAQCGGIPLTTLVFDNLTHLGGDSTSEDAWNAFFMWLHELNALGITVLLLGHANDSGDQRYSARPGLSVQASFQVVMDKINDSENDPDMEGTKIIRLICRKEGDNPYLKENEELVFTLRVDQVDSGEFSAKWNSGGDQKLITRVMRMQKAAGMTYEEQGVFWNNRKPHQVRYFQKKQGLIKK